MRDYKEVYLIYSKLCWDDWVPEWRWCLNIQWTKCVLLDSCWDIIGSTTTCQQQQLLRGEQHYFCCSVSHLKSKSSLETTETYTYKKNHYEIKNDTTKKDKNRNKIGKLGTNFRRISWFEITKIHKISKLIFKHDKDARTCIKILFEFAELQDKRSKFWLPK